MLRARHFLFLILMFSAGTTLFAQDNNGFQITLKGQITDVSESSGLIWTDGKLWTFGDSGNPAELFAIDTANGQILQTLNVENYDNNDWEDIAADKHFIYIGDFGNNYGDRKNLRILKIKKSDIGSNSYQNITAEAINFSYADQSSFSLNKSNNYDCESMISKGDSLYLFSKDRSDFRTRVYALPKTPGTYVVSPVTEYNIGAMVCGADYDSISNQLVLIGYGGHHLNSFLFLARNFTGNQFFSSFKKRVIIGNNYKEWQTEGITFRDSTHVFISCESTSDIPASLYTFDLNQLVISSVSDVSENRFSIFPNPTSGKFNVNLQKRIDRIIIRDLNGRLLYTNAVNGNRISIDLGPLHLKNGFYIAELLSANQAFYSRFLYFSN